jgi:predicted dehydrogenase
MVPFLRRRDFLKGSAALAGFGLLPGARDAAADEQPANNGGANNRLNVAVIGVNGRGKEHIDFIAGRHNCLITHICDTDAAVGGPAVQRAGKLQGSTPRFVQDLRRIMDDRSIDIVTIATPNHWHALAAIWAMQAGKDVYVEKPVSHNVSEGRRIVETARRTNKICQTGTQIRSSTGVAEALDFIKSGKLGKVQVARALCYKRRPSIGRADGTQAVPKSVDYDLWCGPAPRNPLHRLRLHYDWHWQWDCGNGDLGNQGIHQMDVARWGLGKSELPRSVLSLGGRFGYIDDGETANTQICAFDYGEAELIFEVRGLPTKNYRGAGVGNIFHCSDGYLVVPSYNSAVAYSNTGEVLRRFNGARDDVFRYAHFANFVEAVRSRHREVLKADILEGHLSSALCHLGNISYRLGRPTPFNQHSRAFADDQQAGETLARMEEHLHDNQIPVEKITFLLGRRLAIDAKTERFVNDSEADRFLTRPYRKGFEVPARV